MPKHPTSPPYKSTLVVSKSKKIEKFITTIPKPIVSSRWKSWTMKKLDKNKLRWYPTEYFLILNYLEARWNEISVQVFNKIENNERALFYVKYDPDKDINSVNSWMIETRAIPARLSNKWKWIYKPNLPEYLIYNMDKNSFEDENSIKNLQGMKEIIESVLKILLANSK